MSDHLTPSERERLWEAIAGVRDAAPRVANDAATDDIIDAVLDSGWVHRLITSRLAAISTRAEAAEAKVARVEALIDTWERSHSHLGIDRRYWGPSSSDLRAALAPAPTGDTNGRQIGSDERVEAYDGAAADRRNLHDPDSGRIDNWSER